MHFVKRTGYKRFLRRSWPKLTAVFHTATHLILGVVTSRGPSQDSPQFPEAMRQATANLKPTRVLADAGYDAEHNHALCRDELGIRSTAIALNRRRAGRRWPRTRYRRQMKCRFPKRQYRQRVQAESGFSRHKRRLGSSLTARSEPRQFGELRMRVLTHNLMILAA
jgi:Transposase DDE domain